MRARIAIFAAVFESALLLAHGFVYGTWIAFSGMPDPPTDWKLVAIFAALSATFVAASLLAFRYSHVLVRVFYTASAMWMGILSFAFLAACSCWILYAGPALFGLHLARRPLAFTLFGLALLASAYGVVNAARTRVKRISVRLPNLPESWRGRAAALVTDTHLGPVRGYRFLRRIVGMIAKLGPDVVFISGDLYDGTAADLGRITEPLSRLRAPLGTYFVTGNHEEFSDSSKYLDVLKRNGVHVLSNEKVTLDGLQVVGVRNRDSAHPRRLESVLRQAGLRGDRASILLSHSPRGLRIAERAGVSLQLSGHTHGGQFFPFTWITGRIFRQFTYGLERLDSLMVYTSCGAGTWGPPLRVGTKPEIVLIHFE